MQAIEHAPLTFDNLVIEFTNKCNAKCGMCYQSSGPKGSDVLGEKMLPVSTMETTLLDGLKIASLAPSFHLSGGETFLDFPLVKHLFSFAKSIGYLETSATTNAFWGRSSDRAAEIAKQLRNVGLSRIEISWDYWHVEHIQSQAVSNAIIACAENDIPVELRLLATSSHSFEEALVMLDEEAIRACDSLVCFPIIPTGRAATEIERSDILDMPGMVAGACHDALNLTVNSSGSVFPCCAGLDQTKFFQIGNIKDEPIDEIFNVMNSSLLVRTLVFYGPGALVPILEEEGVNIGRDYSTICDLCWTIFSNQRNAEIIESFFHGLQKNAPSQ